MFPPKMARSFPIGGRLLFSAAGSLWGEAGSADLADAAVVCGAFDQFIAQQAEQAIAEEDRPGIAVPVDARRLTGIGRLSAIADRGGKLADLPRVPVSAKASR
jgi:hypothetical protein